MGLGDMSIQGNASLETYAASTMAMEWDGMGWYGAVCHPLVCSNSHDYAESGTIVLTRTTSFQRVFRLFYESNYISADAYFSISLFRVCCGTAYPYR